MPYLLHDAVYLVAIFPSQRTSLDSDIGVSREVLVVTTVNKVFAVVRVWWDDVSWDSAIGDFAVICGWIQTCSDKQVRLSSLVTLEFYAANAYCLSCYRTLLERLNTQTHMLIYHALFLSHNQIFGKYHSPTNTMASIWNAAKTEKQWPKIYQRICHFEVPSYQWPNSLNALSASRALAILDSCRSALQRINWILRV